MPNLSGIFRTSLLLWVLLLPSPTTAAAAAEPLSVGASIPPQRYFLEQIGADLLDITVLLERGGDPHSFSPTAQQMRKLSQASLLFTAGLAAEQQWVGRVASLAPKLQVIAAPTAQPDLHFWLSPSQVQVYVATLRDALLDADPANAAIYTKNAARFLSQLQGLHAELQMLFASVGERNRFLVQHAAWEVFAEDYGLQQIVIEEEGKSVTVKGLAELITLGRRLGIHTVFTDPSHGSKEARVIAAQIAAQVQQLNPLAENWPANLRLSADAIKEALR